MLLTNTPKFSLHFIRFKTRFEAVQSLLEEEGRIKTKLHLVFHLSGRKIIILKNITCRISLAYSVSANGICFAALFSQSEGTTLALCHIKRLSLTGRRAIIHTIISGTEGKSHFDYTLLRHTDCSGLLALIPFLHRALELWPAMSRHDVQKHRTNRRYSQTFSISSYSPKLFGAKEFHRENSIEPSIPRFFIGKIPLKLYSLEIVPLGVKAHRPSEFAFLFCSAARGKLPSSISLGKALSSPFALGFSTFIGNVELRYAWLFLFNWAVRSFRMSPIGTFHQLHQVEISCVGKLIRRRSENASIQLQDGSSVLGVPGATAAFKRSHSGFTSASVT